MLTVEHLAAVVRDNELPYPGSGQTLERWSRLADVAEQSLGLVKLFEAHTDALAILRELDQPAQPLLYGVYAAGGAPLVADGTNGNVRLVGRKPWCSGAELVDVALVSCIDADGEPRLAEVAIRQPGVSLASSTWAAHGMAEARTVDVLFEGAEARLIGAPRQYVERPGFWHGAIGIAACWYGGARGVARHLRSACCRRADAHAFAHLGLVDRSLRSASDMLREAARLIDRDPLKNVQGIALAVRDLVEEVATRVVCHADRALGPAPRATDGGYARRVEDLTLFIRQNHAERDREALGRLCAEAASDEWELHARDA